MRTLSPPRHSLTLPLVVTAVLSLAFAGTAHALSVDIVVPDTDPADVYQHLRAPFLAVCRDEKGNDVSDRATFAWSFPDAKEPTVGNPVTHRFPKLGKFLVSVTATLEKDCASDQVTVNVVELVATRALPSADDFELFIRIPQGDPLDPEACDDVEVVCQSKITGRWPFLPFEWCNTKFYKWVDNDWEFMGEDNPGMYDDVRWSSYITWHTVADPNAAVQWKAEMYLYDMMDPPGDPASVFPYLTAYFTPNNTVVKARGDEAIILHDAEDTSHTIQWKIDHCEDVDPTFTVTVTIYDLDGDLVATLVEEEAALGDGSTDWDENLPQTDGIYTYKIVANHQDMAPPQGPCEDQDKSWQLGITLDGFYWFQKNWVGGTLKGVVKYTLTHDAAPYSVTIRFFGPDLQELDGAAGPLEGQPYTAGTHVSDVYEIDVAYDENDELIEPIYCVVYADECEADAASNRDGLSKPALQKGTADLRAGLQILQPDGFPHTDNHFSFDAEPFPDGACAIAATGTASGLVDDAELQWWLSPTISGSTLTTEPSPPEGPSVTFTYTGLPVSNSEFGPELLRLTHSSLPRAEDTQEVEVFFQVDAKNHGLTLPGWANATPNWYYYWREGDVVSDLASFLYAEGPGFGSYSPATDRLYVHDAAWTSNAGTQVTNRNTSQVETIGADGTGVDCCAETCAHELEHQSVSWTSFGQLDTDGDGVSDALEDSTHIPGGYFLDKYWQDTYDSASIYGQQYFDDGDDEFLARKAEQQPGSVTPEADWSGPPYGRNWMHQN